MRVPRGFWVVLAFMAIALFISLQGGSGQPVAPAFVSGTGQHGYVELCYPGDAEHPSVIVALAAADKSAHLLHHVASPDMRSALEQYLAAHHPVSGQRLSVVRGSNKKVHIVDDYMSAARRMVLDIPLHPDHMTRKDWQALPGIGKNLAADIITERQKNGSFGTVAALVRVHGIGRVKLKAVQTFFSCR